MAKKPAQVLEFLYLGGKEHAKDKKVLEDCKITHILNVTPPRTVDPSAGVPNYFESLEQYKYKRYPIFDTIGEDILSRLDECVDFIHHAKFHGKILVHCNKGISRSSSIVIAYLMQKMEFKLEEAIAFLSDRAPQINPNASFRRQLEEYQKALVEKLATTDENHDKKRSSDTIGPSLPPKRSKKETSS